MAKIFFIILIIFIILIGLLANRELARDKKRIKRMIREYSFRSYPADSGLLNALRSTLFAC